MTTPAGWYPNTAVPGTERYWDGSAWTDETRTQSKQEMKASAKAAAESQKQLAAQQRQQEKDAAAFAATPVGEAVTARDAGQGFFEIQLVVGHSQRDSTIFGGNNFALAKTKTVTHAGTLSAIEAVGWRLEHVGYIFQVTSESSRDKFLATGQQTAVSGRNVGIYLFRAVA